MAGPVVTGMDAIVQAMQDLGVLQAGETPSGDDADDVLTQLNRLIDSWNAQQENIYTSEFLTFLLVANVQPLTIGPTGANYTVSQRPVSIDAANVILNNTSPTTRVPLVVHTDPQWWMSVSVPGTATTLSSDLYYQPTWPNGNIYLWCKQAYPYTLELLVRLVFSAAEFSTQLVMPQGYWNALVLTLAENIAPMFKRVVRPDLARRAREARMLIQANNTVVPSIRTTDAGMPDRSSGNRSNWNYLNGSVNGRFP